jgi:hypothetical protein
VSTEIKLANGKTWFTHACCIEDDIVGVVIPPKQITGMTDEEIGAGVRACMQAARLELARRDAYKATQNNGVSDYLDACRTKRGADEIRDWVIADLAKIAPFREADPDLERACQDLEKVKLYAEGVLSKRRGR